MNTTAKVTKFTHSIESAISKIQYSLVSTKTLKITPSVVPYVTVFDGKHTKEMKLGKVLKHYDSSLSDARIKYLVESYKAFNAETSDYTVEYSKEYEEVYQVPLYALGSTYLSCMTKNNAVGIYHYDERLSLLLAKKDNELVLRTLVRSDTKEYIRIYIDHNKIREEIAVALVEKEGYVTKGNLDGIMLDYVEVSSGILLPYLDGNVDRVSVYNDRYLLVNSDGDIESNEYGIASLRYCECTKCSARIDEGEEYSNETGEVFCEECFYEIYIYINGDLYLVDDCITNESTGELVPKDLAHDMDIYEDDNGEWYSLNELCIIDSCYYHYSKCVELVEEDEDGNTYALRDDAYEVQYIDDMEDGFYTRDQINNYIANITNDITVLQEKRSSLLEII